MGNSLCGTLRERGCHATRGSDSGFKDFVAFALKTFILMNYLFAMYWIFALLYCFVKRYVCKHYGCDGKCCNVYSESQTISDYQSTVSQNGSSVVSSEDQSAECIRIPLKCKVCTVGCQSPPSDSGVSGGESYKDFPEEKPCIRMPRDRCCQTSVMSRPSLYERTKQWRTLFTCPWSERVRQRFQDFLSIPRAILACPEPREGYYQGGRQLCPPSRQHRPQDMGRVRTPVDCVQPVRQVFPEDSSSCLSRPMSKRECKPPRYKRCNERPKTACDRSAQRDRSQVSQPRQDRSGQSRSGSKPCDSSVEKVRVEFDVSKRPPPPEMSLRSACRPMGRSKPKRCVEYVPVKVRKERNCVKPRRC